MTNLYRTGNSEKLTLRLHWPFATTVKAISKKAVLCLESTIRRKVVIVPGVQYYMLQLEYTPSFRSVVAGVSSDTLLECCSSTVVLKDNCICLSSERSRLRRICSSRVLGWIFYHEDLWGSTKTAGVQVGTWTSIIRSSAFSHFTVIF